VISLRPYQTAAIEAVRQKIAQGKRAIVVVAPCGAGKTVLASEMVRSATERGRRVVFLAHRKELVDQAVDKLSRFEISAGVQMGQDARRDDFLPTQVCSIQTLARRIDRLPPGDLVIVDECHHSMSSSYSAVLDAYPNAVVVGLTATPFRSDRIGLSDRYDDHVIVATTAELMASGALVEYDCFAYDSPELEKIGTVAGEYNQKQLGFASNTDVLVGNVVEEYISHARGRRAVVFAVNIAHSNHLVDEFRARGVTAAHVDFETPKMERGRILEAFARGEIEALCSVAIFTEGWDCPAAEVCILARPTKSLGLYHQMVGRVLRPSPGKARALIHDHSGNCLRHGFIEDPRDYSLTATPERVRALHTCPNCCRVFGAPRPDGTCPHCNALIAEPSNVCKLCGELKVGKSGLGFCECERGGDRKEKTIVDGVRINIDEIRARRAAAGLTRNLTDRQIARAARATRAEKAAEYLRLQEVAARKGFKKGFVYHQFRGVFGHGPKFTEAELAGVAPAARPFIPLEPRQEKAA